MAYTEEDIKSFINTELANLNLNTREMERYFKFIKKVDTHIESHKYKFASDAFSFIEQKLEELYSRFIQEGYDDKESLELTKKALLFSDRNELATNLNFIRAIGLEQQALKQDILFFRRRIESAHAKKMYLVKENNKEAQNIFNILRTTDKSFEKEFPVNMTKLLKEYPITDELKQVLAYQANLTDQELKNEFKLSREEMSLIYPTTLEQLSTLKMIAKLSDKEIKERYGITRQNLLQKYPLNNDTLKALKSIELSKESTIEKIFHQSKEEVLHLRTITTDMIKLANQKMKLQKGTYSKEELLEKFKCMKKGTIN